MVTGFYGSLAAAASVFIGILTALLANDLSNLKAERDRIERRVGAINARLSSLDDQYQHFKDRIENFRERKEAEEKQEQAEKQVDSFIENYVGSDFDISPEDLTPRKAQREFEDFLGVDKLNEYQHRTLQNRYEDVESALTTSSNLVPTIDDFPLKPEVSAMNRQIEHQWEIHSEQRYNRNYRRWIQTMTEIQSLQEEREKLEDRYKSLDPTSIRDSLKATVVAIVFAVGVPLFAYLLRVVGFTPVPLPVAIEAAIVFVLWGAGLVHVFYHLREKLVKEEEETTDLPKAPELAIDEEITDHEF